MATDAQAALAAEQQSAQEDADAAVAATLLVAWERAYYAARARLDAFLADVDEARAAGVQVNRTWLAQARRLDRVLDVAQVVLEDYAELGAQATGVRQANAITSALDEAADLVRLPWAVAGIPSPPLAAPTNAATLAGLMGDGTPIAQHFAATIADDAVDDLRDVLTEGVVRGQSTQDMADDVTRRMALSHTRATTIVRTESIRVYRETSRQTYAQNPDLVRSWTWSADLGRRTCVACAVMHGTRHPITETLDDHPRGRCAMLPDTPTWAELGVPGLTDPPPLAPGTDWIMALPPDQLAAFLGPSKYAALMSGDYALTDFVARSYSPTWGTMRTERSMRAIREGRNRNYGGLDDYLGASA